MNSKRPRLDSYPMHLREPVTAVEPGYLQNVYARRPTQPPSRSVDHTTRIAELKALLAHSRALKQTPK